MDRDQVEGKLKEKEGELTGDEALGSLRTSPNCPRCYRLAPNL